MASTEEGRRVEAARNGDQRAFGELFDQWFDRVHDLARRIVRDDGIAGEVAQDAFLNAWTKLDSLDDVDAFGGWLLRIARNGALNRLEKERRSVSVDDATMAAAADARAPDIDPLARMDQAARIELVWDAASALGPRDASVLDLHLRHGLTPAELADELGCTPNNAHQVLFTMRKRLATSVKALVLWRAGRPSCDDLRRGLAAAGLTSFGAPMVKAIDRHASSCDTCSSEREDRLAPAALFGAAPVVAAAPLIKSTAAAGLAAQGVPMSGSSATVAGGTGGTGGAAAGDGEAIPIAGGGPPGSTSHRRVLVLAAVALLLVAGVAAVVQQSSDGPTQVAMGLDVDLEDVADTTGSVSTVPPVSELPPSTETTVAPTTAPIPPPTTAPVPVPPPTPKPPPPDPTTTEPVAAPTIDSFTAVSDSTVDCSVPGGPPQPGWKLTWTTTDADTATLGPIGGAGTSVPTDGTTEMCAPSAANGFTLVATGPGGQVSQTKP